MMKKFLFVGLLLFMGVEALQAQKNFTYTSDIKERIITPGKGQEYDRAFIPVGDFHFVQFGVYPPDADLTKIGAPPDFVGQVWLIYHEDTRIKGSSKQGAIYIVKPFGTAEDARRAAKDYESQKVSSWYNPALAGATFVLVGITPY
jgi:hypothetical protein